MPSEPPRFDPDEYQRPFWEPIGKFVFAFGYMEKDIDWCISALLRADQIRQGPSVASQIRNLSSRIALVGALFRLVASDPQQRAAADDLLARAKNLASYRNWLLHGPWAAFHVETQRWQKTRVNPQNFKMQSMEFDVASIEEKCAETTNVAVQLSNLIQKACAEPEKRVP